MSGIEIAVTCVPSSKDAVVADAKKISAFCPRIHLDVDDGVFAPVVTWPYLSAGHSGPVDISDVTELLRADVHLMIEEPQEVGLDFIAAGVERVIGHIEAFSDDVEIIKTLNFWKDHDVEVGLGILLGTELELLDPYIAQCDFVHMMTIATIGTQGIPYEPRGVERIRALHEKYPHLIISVDGGVAESNIADLVRAGARRFGVGSAISKATNPGEAYTKLLSLAESVLR